MLYLLVHIAGPIVSTLIGLLFRINDSALTLCDEGARMDFSHIDGIGTKFSLR